MPMIRLLCGFALLATACAAPAGAPSPTPTAPPPTAPASPTHVPTARPAGAITFTVGGGSKATVRVREQLANLPAPSDAVLVTSGVTGSFALQQDGTFDPGAQIVVDLTLLDSDSDSRDRFIKDSTLGTRQFPKATFVPTRTVGLALPLGTGDLAFKVVGNMTIRGTTKEVSFDVAARRAGGTITARAVNAPTWKFADFGLQQPRVFSVLSIVDEIRLEVDLVVSERST